MENLAPMIFIKYILKMKLDSFELPDLIYSKKILSRMILLIIVSIL